MRASGGMKEQGTLAEPLGVAQQLLNEIAGRAHGLGEGLAAGEIGGDGGRETRSLCRGRDRREIGVRIGPALDRGPGGNR